MLKKRNILGLLFALAVLVKIINSPTVPNQQITLQFSNEHLTDDTALMLTIIENELENIGASAIEVSQDNNGQFKIIYFSRLNVSKIQSLLSAEENFNFIKDLEDSDDKEEPLNKSLRDYQLDMSEIKKTDTKSDWDFDGVQVAEYNPKSDRLSQPKVNYTAHSVRLQINNRLCIVKLKVHHSKKGFSSNNHTYNIPEVRAGPLV